MTKWQFRIVAGLVYFVMLSVILFGLMRARVWVDRAYGSPKARSDWGTFRQDIARQSAEKSTPVRRQVPQSSEPPALVLMRDYFSACVAISWVLSTALYVTTMFLVGGVVLKPDSPTPTNTT